MIVNQGRIMMTPLFTSRFVQVCILQILWIAKEMYQRRERLQYTDVFATQDYHSSQFLQNWTKNEDKTPEYLICWHNCGIKLGF